jgi:hypothetical protein
MNDETNEPNDKERQEMIQRILVVARGEAIKRVDPVTGETIYKYNEVSGWHATRFFPAVAGGLVPLIARTEAADRAPTSACQKQLFLLLQETL